MKTEVTVFERNYKQYLEQLEKISFESIAQKLGATIDGNAIKIALYNNVTTVSDKEITGPEGEKPSYDICVILCKYLLLCPDTPPKDDDWVSYRNFKDSGPLINYFTNNVERNIATYFTEKLDDLTKASKILNGYPPVLDVNYDFSMQFDALPRIPVILLFNDLDEEFSAKCTVLFESRADKYLDAECIAMLGWQLFRRLKMALKDKRIEH